MKSPAVCTEVVGTHQRGRAHHYETACVVIAMALTVGCSGNSPTSPAAPSVSEVSSVSVTQVSATSRSCQLAATARFSDGTTRDVTTAAQWDSSNPSLATVTNTGVVTVVAAGDVEVRATYQSVSGTFQLITRPEPVVTLWGVVREVQPNQHPLAGARVEIVDGENAGRVVVSDQSGGYVFTGLSMGRASLVVTLAGYQTWRLSNLPLPGNTLEDPWLVPEPPKNAAGVPATARCRNGSWSWELDRSTACKENGGLAYVVCPGPLCPPN
jgi:hypothetical protein